MEKSERLSERRVRPTQIIGFRLSQDLAREVKAEAAHRGMKLTRLFEELWEQYRRRRPRA